MIDRNRLDVIAREVIDLLGVTDIFAFLNSEATGFEALEARLQEVMSTRPSFQSIELAMYLRSCYNYSNDLPTWKPLLNAAIEQSNMRGDNTSDIFYGMIDAQPVTNRNSGGPR